MRAAKPAIGQVLVKLNEGVSGDGNALVDLSAVPTSGGDGERDAVEQAVRAMQLEAAGTPRAAAWSRSASPGREFTSPSVQMNLRKGGTTHPLLTLQYLTDGVYDPERAMFTVRSGRAKFLVASDHVDSPDFRGLTPDDVFDLGVRHGLHYNPLTETGVVFHMLSALASDGHRGLTAIGDSHEQARELFDEMVAVLEADGADAMAPRPLPD